MTGPTHPYRGTVVVSGQAVRYKLPRTHAGSINARVSVPEPGPNSGGILRFRRFRTDDEFRAVPLRHEHGQLYAMLPSQPPAGKLEYQLGAFMGHEMVTIPPDRTVVIRFKGDVPLVIIVPHILLMFMGMLFSLRTGMEFFAPGERLRRLAWYTFAMLFVGGMILGPVVQWYAFGQLWTGVPFGWDLTDNKTLIAVIFWAIAIVLLGLPGQPVRKRARALTGLATLVTFLIFLIPHSLFGSELDYTQMDKGIPPSEAIRQG